MPTSDILKRPFRISAILLLGFLLMTPSFVAAQDDEERRRAFQLYNDAKHKEALTLFEKLAVTYPNDPDVIETFGLLVMTQTAYLKDAAARKQARLRGREILLRAQKLGANSPLLKATLERPIDDDAGFSTKKEVDDVMREGEGAFAGGNYTKAIE